MSNLLSASNVAFTLEDLWQKRSRRAALFLAHSGFDEGEARHRREAFWRRCVVPWMGHALQADMGNTKETRMDVSPHFLWLLHSSCEKSSRNVDNSTFSVARYVYLDVALGTAFASMLALPLRLAFRRE
jgi:hypothetical protein